jgi:hypothetical protein
VVSFVDGRGGSPGSHPTHCSFRTRALPKHASCMPISKRLRPSASTQNPGRLLDTTQWFGDAHHATFKDRGSTHPCRGWPRGRGCQASHRRSGCLAHKVPSGFRLPPSLSTGSHPCTLTCPVDSHLVHFTYAEMEEARKRFPEASQEDIEQQVAALDESESIDEAAARSAADTPTVPDFSSTGADMNGEIDETKQRERAKQRAKDKQLRQDLEEMRKGSSPACIVLMRFARRAEGIQATRQIFKVARQGYATPHVFVNAGHSPHTVPSSWIEPLLTPLVGWLSPALTEYHCSKDPVVGGKIFELGLRSRSYEQDPDHVTQHLEHLIHMNDDHSKTDGTRFPPSTLVMSPGWL